MDKLKYLLILMLVRPLYSVKFIKDEPTDICGRIIYIRPFVTDENNKEENLRYIYYRFSQL